MTHTYDLRHAGPAETAQVIADHLGFDPGTAQAITHAVAPADADRAEFTAALRQLADYLDEHPDLPVPQYDHAYIAPTPAGGCDAERRADVDRIAAVLDVTPADLADGSHHEAAVTFGGRIRYRVTAITDARMDGHRAEATYYGAVQP